MIALEYYSHKNHETTQLLEMAEVGRIGGMKISVYGGEGPIPHFHFYYDNPSEGGCIRLDKPEYFSHGRHTRTLSSSEKKEMISFLKSPHKSFGKYGLTNWQVICIYWDDNNKDFPFDKDAPMPDYSKL